MGRGSTALAKRRLDKFYKLAKDEGYKSRAAFKLIQINKEYNILGNCRCVIDLCAAPGGWTQVALKYMPLSSLLIAVDIIKMKSIGDAKIIKGDIYSQKCKFDIKRELKGWKADCVLHDGAPNVTGTWSRDAYGQCKLTLQALKLSTNFLSKGGWFITKVFRSSDYNSLLWVIKHFFDSVETFKPIASRQSSAEIYFICKGYLSPKSIDSRLLNPSFVFREIEETKENISVMRLRKRKKNEKPNRMGYENEDYKKGLINKTTNVLDFINSDNPESILGLYNSFTFDDSHLNKLILNNNKTDFEIKQLLKDLKILAKVDFRKLLKWRLKIIKYLKPFLENETVNEKEEINKEKSNDKVKTQQELEEEEDLKIRSEVQNILISQHREHRKKKRKIRQAKIKSTRTMLMGGLKPDDVFDRLNEQDGLFSLNKFSNQQELDEFANNEHILSLKPQFKNKNKKYIRGLRRENIYFDDSDDEYEYNETQLNNLYNLYKKKKNIVNKKESKQLIKNSIFLQSDNDSNDENNSDINDVSMNDIKNIKNEIDNAQLSKGGNLLINNKSTCKEDNADKWFNDNIFNDINMIDKRSVLPLAIKSSILEDNDEEMKDKSKLKYKDLPDVLRLPYRLQRKLKKMNRDHRRRLQKEEARRIERDCLFEEVPIKINKNLQQIENTHENVNPNDRKIDKFLDEEYKSDSSDNDSDTIAETLAIGTRMVTSKKDRFKIINNSYHRFAFEDNDNLPVWFKEDENEAYPVNLPVTKEEVQKYKERMKAINARPIKKVAEAKARKKLRAMRIWNRIKKTATGIANSTEISEKSKIKQIQALYKKMDKKRKITKVLMIGGKGHKPKPADGKRPPKNAVRIQVDKRLKSDKLGLKHANKRKKYGKKPKNLRQRNKNNLRRKRNRKR